MAMIRKVKKKGRINEKWEQVRTGPWFCSLELPWTCARDLPWWSKWGGWTCARDLQVLPSRPCRPWWTVDGGRRGPGGGPVRSSFIMVDHERRSPT